MRSNIDKYQVLFSVSESISTSIKSESVLSKNLENDIWI